MTKLKALLSVSAIALTAVFGEAALAAEVAGSLEKTDDASCVSFETKTEVLEMLLEMFYEIPDVSSFVTAQMEKGSGLSKKVL